MASASPDLQSPSQPQSVAALWPVSSYTAWWQRHTGAQGHCLMLSRQDLNLWIINARLMPTNSAASIPCQSPQQTGGTPWEYTQNHVDGDMACSRDVLEQQWSHVVFITWHLQSQRNIAGSVVHSTGLVIHLQTGRRPLCTTNTYYCCDRHWKICKWNINVAIYHLPFWPSLVASFATIRLGHQAVVFVSTVHLVPCYWMPGSEGIWYGTHMLTVFLQNFLY